MTNREIMLELFTNDIYRLAKALIKTEMVDDGYYRYDGEDEYWVEQYEETYESPNGYSYDSLGYDECLQETIDWLKRERVEEEE